jgi:ferredoxin
MPDSSHYALCPCCKKGFLHFHIYEGQAEAWSCPNCRCHLEFEDFAKPENYEPDNGQQLVYIGKPFPDPDPPEPKPAPEIPAKTLPVTISPQSRLMICSLCRQPYTAASLKSRYCTNACKQTAYRRRRDLRVVFGRCDTCQRDFLGPGLTIATKCTTSQHSTR